MDDPRIAELTHRIENLEKLLREHLGPKGQTSTPQIPHSNMARASTVETSEAALQASIDAVEVIAIAAGRYL